MLGFQEQALVDSKDPDAKPLPVSKMIVHHFLYYTRGGADRGPRAGASAACASLRAREEHPDGRFDAAWPRSSAPSTASTTSRPPARRRSGP